MCCPWCSFGQLPPYCARSALLQVQHQHTATSVVVGAGAPKLGRWCGCQKNHATVCSAAAFDQSSIRARFSQLHIAHQAHNHDYTCQLATAGEPDQCLHSLSNSAMHCLHGHMLLHMQDMIAGSVDLLLLSS